MGGRRQGVFWRVGAAAAGGRGGRLRGVVGVLGQKRERRLDGGGVGIWVVLLVAGKPVANVVRCVWELFIKPP